MPLLYESIRSMDKKPYDNKKVYECRKSFAVRY